MEGLLPYVYRAIVQYRGNAGDRIYGALASSSPGDSGNFSWDSAYIRLPGDSGRFASDIHGLLMEAQPSQTIYRRPPHHSTIPALSNSTANNNNGARNERHLWGNTNVRLPPAPAAAGQHVKSN